ncbi:TauD/TfdA family dioxygenase [Kitasatospora sp. NBC_00374]|uniref:TauD/TfdA family dioxygenase n=1 Tax=Kitasatospora sp. NBC_00374 TaxID=2975964 RepID=UPI0032467F81
MVEVIDLSPETRSALGRLSDRITADPYRSGMAFVEEARAATPHLPSELVRSLARAGAHEGTPVLLVRGLPVPSGLPPTPNVKFDHQREIGRLGTEALLALLGSCVGEIFTYREWDSGHMVQNRYPIASHRTIQSATGSTELVLHTEAAFAALSPDHLVLLGLRADPGSSVQTVVADIGTALESISASSRRQLAAPMFAFPSDHGSHMAGGPRMTEPHPILRQTTEGLCLDYQHSITPLSPEGAMALAELNAAFTAAAEGVTLRSGEALVIDNRRAVHGRTALQPRFDGTDRWIQRVLLRRTLPADERVVSDSRFDQYPSEFRSTLARPK